MLIAELYTLMKKHSKSKRKRSGHEEIKASF